MPKLPSVFRRTRHSRLETRWLCRAMPEGSHISLEKRAGDQVFKTVVPMHSELSKGTLSDILRQCGLKLDEFLELL
jgi:predicted RNA binding protein YcfA (HicA-like mRNA interferase family)